MCLRQTEFSVVGVFFTFLKASGKILINLFYLEASSSSYAQTRLIYSSVKLSKSLFLIPSWWITCFWTNGGISVLFLSGINNFSYSSSKNAGIPIKLRDSYRKSILKKSALVYLLENPRKGDAFISRTFALPSRSIRMSIP